MTPAAVLLRRALRPLLVLGVAGGMATALVTARQPPGVDVALGFMVPIPEEVGARTSSGRSIADPVEATDLFVGTLSGWLSSPDFAAKVYQRASLPAPATSVRKLGRVFTAQRHGGQVVGVRFRARTADDATRIANALRDEVGERSTALAAGSPTFAFRVSVGEPLVVPVRPYPLLRGLVSGIVILAVGLNAVFLRDFLRSS